jgi:hypothetical protein
LRDTFPRDSFKGKVKRKNKRENAKKLSFQDLISFILTYVREIKYLKEKGNIEGDDKEYFKSKKTITREKVALVVYEVMKLIKQT